MEKQRLDHNLNETVHSTFSLMGHFSTSPKIKDILEGSTGTLNYHDGMAEVEMTPTITYTVSDGAFFDVDSEEDDIIYGYLEDGTYVRFNSFASVQGMYHIPGFSVKRYEVYDLDFSKKKFNSEVCTIYDHLLVTYDSLNEFGAFVIPNLMEQNIIENPPVFIGGDENFDVYLTYEWKKCGNRVNVNAKAQVELEIRIKKPNSKIDDFIKDFGDFLSITET